MHLSKRYRDVLIFVLAMTILFMILYRHTLKQYEELKNNRKVVSATVYDATSLRASPLQINYFFVVNNTRVNRREGIEVDKIGTNYLKKVFVGKKMVAVYDALDSSNSRLLLSLRDYKEFGLMPDSATLQVFKMINRFRVGPDAADTGR